MTKAAAENVEKLAYKTISLYIHSSLIATLRTGAVVVRDFQARPISRKAQL